MNAEITTFGREQEQLPSWREGINKKAILEFIHNASNPDHSAFIPQEDRIGVFDNDGTLWAENPYPEFAWLFYRLQELSTSTQLDLDPDLQEVLDAGMESFYKISFKSFAKIIYLTGNTLGYEDLSASTNSFMHTGEHIYLKRPYIHCRYQPMLELKNLLEQHGFTIYICTGGTTDFVASISSQLYNIPPGRVIGTAIRRNFLPGSGKIITWRRPEEIIGNNKGTKVENIKEIIGKIPVFSAGNVHSGGDIAMLSHSSSIKPSLQLLIHHDDDEREQAYGDEDTASLEAALVHGWTVLSVRDDWKVVFTGD